MSRKVCKRKHYDTSTSPLDYVLNGMLPVRITSPIMTVRIKNHSALKAAATGTAVFNDFDTLVAAFNMGEALATRATTCLLAQQPISVTRHVTTERKGFPLPMRRMPPDADGNVTQDYRPMAILEWVDDTLVAAAKAERAVPAVAECDDLFGG